MSKKTTIHDIADEVGVGAGTVSRVLNGHPNVSEKTRQKVLQAMDRLGYRPNYSARHMRMQHSRVIGVLADQVTTTPYAVDIIRGAQEAAWEQNKILLVLSPGDDLEYADEAVEIMLERQVEVIIYAAMWHHKVKIPANVLEVPTILVNCFEEEHGLPAIVPDEVHGGYTATKHLIDQGHQRIGFINLQAHIPAGVGRLQGYHKALHEAGITPDPDLIHDNTANNSESGYQHTLALMQSDNPPTGIFAGTDNIAVGVYDALKELGYSIPNDVAVVGFDNQIAIATSLRPSLTTIQLPHYEMGRIAFERLLEHQASGQELSGQMLLPCPLVKRNSS